MREGKAWGHLPGVPRLHVNRPLKRGQVRSFWSENDFLIFMQERKKCFALCNVLKLRVFETRKWPIPSMPKPFPSPRQRHLLFFFFFLSFFFFSESCKFATLLTRNRGPWKFVSLQINVVVVVVVVVVFLKNFHSDRRQSTTTSRRLPIQ